MEWDLVSLAEEGFRGRETIASIAPGARTQNWMLSAVEQVQDAMVRPRSLAHFLPVINPCFKAVLLALKIIAGSFN